jgi:hypothetical protein
MHAARPGCSAIILVALCVILIAINPVFVWPIGMIIGFIFFFC